jgi:hypothetical protein
VSTGRKKPQVPPLRFAPVGMTILLRGLKDLLLELLRAQQNCHPDRSEAQWRDLRFFPEYSHPLLVPEVSFSSSECNRV